jgi:formylglycine-generating enzyme required for sulfatase activity
MKPEDRQRMGLLARMPTAVFVVFCLLVAALASVSAGIYAGVVALFALRSLSTVERPSDMALAVGLCFWLIGFVLPAVALRRRRKRERLKLLHHPANGDDDEEALARSDQRSIGGLGDLPSVRSGRRLLKGGGNRKRMGLLAQMPHPVFVLLCWLVAIVASFSAGSLAFLLGMFALMLRHDTEDTDFRIVAAVAIAFWLIGFVLPVFALHMRRERQRSMPYGHSPIGNDDEETQKGEAKSRIFISYSRKDMPFADRLEAALKARGFEPLIDRTEIFAFEDWWKRIQALIGRADTVVFVLSPDAVGSETVLKEITYAATLNKRFAPVVCRRVEDKAVPEALRRLNYIFFDDPARSEESADLLAKALLTDIGWIRQHTEYGEAARRWSTAGGPRGLLLHSPTLEMAEHWILSRPPRGAPAPTEQMEAYVAASREGARSAQRLRRVAQASVPALLLGLLAWIFEPYIGEKWHSFRTEGPFVAKDISPYVLQSELEQALKPKDVFRECAASAGSDDPPDACPEMVVVPAGSFMMGSPPTEKGRASNEGPLHKVTIAKPFAVSKFELTGWQWATCIRFGNCVGVAPASAQAATNVTWRDAKIYVAWLSKATGKPYRLLTEAEYEYAARAGTRTAYPWGDDVGRNNAHCKGCDSVQGLFGESLEDQPLPPRRLIAPNPFGLYNMLGDVWEWVEDCWHDSYEGAPVDGSDWGEEKGGGCALRRVVRGGSWSNTPDKVRSASRGFFDPDDSRHDNLGFRVARTLISP